MKHEYGLLNPTGDIAPAFDVLYHVRLRQRLVQYVIVLNAAIILCTPASCRLGNETVILLSCYGSHNKHQPLGWYVTMEVACECPQGYKCFKELLFSCAFMPHDNSWFVSPGRTRAAALSKVKQKQTCNNFIVTLGVGSAAIVLTMWELESCLTWKAQQQTRTPEQSSHRIASTADKQTFEMGQVSLCLSEWGDNPARVAAYEDDSHCAMAGVGLCAFLTYVQSFS